ncbi:hypothetical protein [Actinomyces wuliandei]|uniref:hypothetical protein n=1 Tax=Actinomyces wuliandei TaxID=2057743 RepID=UPI000FD9EE85|nr:hypothetical protein [Actinomyces wuliandei]
MTQNPQHPHDPEASGPQEPGTAGYGAAYGDTAGQQPAYPGGYGAVPPSAQGGDDGAAARPVQSGGYGAVPPSAQGDGDGYGAPPGGLPPGMGPTSAPDGGGTGFQPSSLPLYPRVQVGPAWRWAWSRVTGNPAVFGGGPLFLVVFYLLMAACVFPLSTVVENASDTVSWVLLVPLVAVLLAFLLGLITVAAGVYHACLVAARGERARLRDFLVFPNRWRTVAVYLVATVLTLAGLLVIIGAPIVAYFCLFAMFVSLDQGTPVFQSISRSFSMMRHGASNDMVPLFLVILVQNVVGYFSAIGILFTFPAGLLMAAYAYVRLSASSPGQPGYGEPGYGQPGHPGYGSDYPGPAGYGQSAYGQPGQSDHAPGYLG